jgi:hypothetical protein
VRKRKRGCQTTEIPIPRFVQKVGKIRKRFKKIEIHKKSKIGRKKE